MGIGELAHQVAELGVHRTGLAHFRRPADRLAPPLVEAHETSGLKLLHPGRDLPAIVPAVALAKSIQKNSIGPYWVQSSLSCACRISGV